MLSCDHVNSVTSSAGPDTKRYSSKLVLVLAGSIGSILVICEVLNELEDHSLFKRTDRCEDEEDKYSWLISPKTVSSGG